MKATFLGISIAVAALAMNDTAASKEMTLRGGFFIPAAKEPFTVAFNMWVKSVNDDGKGLVQISPVVGPAAVPGGQWCNFIKAGTIQIVGIPPAYCANLVPGLEALDASDMPPSEQRKKGVYDFVRQLTKSRANAHMLAQYGYGVKYHIYTKKKVTNLTEFKGMRFRTNPTYTPLYKALGINGLQMPNGEIYTAMERGVIDGYALPPTVIVPFGLHKVSKYRFAPGFYSPTVIILINQRSWDAMDAKQKAYMDKKGLELETRINGQLVARVNSIMKRMEQLGLETVTPSPQVSQDFVKIAYDAMWKDLLAKAPRNGAKLKALLTQ